MVAITVPTRSNQAEAALSGLIAILTSDEYKTRLAEWVKVKTDALAAAADIEAREQQVAKLADEVSQKAAQVEADWASLAHAEAALAQDKADHLAAEAVTKQHFDDVSAKLEAERAALIDERAASQAQLDTQKAALEEQSAGLHDLANQLQDAKNALAEREQKMAAAEAEIEATRARLSAALAA